MSCLVLHNNIGTLVRQMDFYKHCCNCKTYNMIFLGYLLTSCVELFRILGSIYQWLYPYLSSEYYPELGHPLRDGSTQAPNTNCSMCLHFVRPNNTPISPLLDQGLSHLLAKPPFLSEKLDHILSSQPCTKQDRLGDQLGFPVIHVWWEPWAWNCLVFPHLTKTPK